MFICYMYATWKFNVRVWFDQLEAIHMFICYMYATWKFNEIVSKLSWQNSE